MTITPWGDVRDLRARRLTPGPGKAARMVRRNQRERIFAAMVATVAERGYGATRVADVIELAGLSRSTFYGHFDNRLDCMLRLLEEMTAGAEATLVAALERDAPWDARLRATFDALVELTIAQPAAARVCLVEAYAAGPAAIAVVDRMARRVGRRALAVVRESPERVDMPLDVPRAVLGGLRTVVQSRVYARRERDLADLAPELMDWALDYRTPPEPLRAAARRRSRRRAPPPGERHPHERIVAAVVEIAAAKGFATVTITEIATAAGVSLSTFYDRFAGKQEAFEAALDDLMHDLLELILPAYRDADDWAHGVRAGIEALLDHLSREPAAARFVAEALWAGGPTALARLGDGMRNFEALLAEGLRRRSPGSHVAAEAIAASILALIYDDLTRVSAQHLHEIAPPATFVALAPAIGTIEACAVVNGA